jgi:hypothetical protein
MLSALNHQLQYFCPYFFVQIFCLRSMPIYAWTPLSSPVRGHLLWVENFLIRVKQGRVSFRGTDMSLLPCLQSLTEQLESCIDLSGGSSVLGSVGL